jgi:NADH-quinone oxidoreductase subunit J
MLELAPNEPGRRTDRQRWGPVLLLSFSLLVCTLLLIGIETTTADGVPAYYASPREFGYALFKEYALAIEVVSFQLLFAAVGAFYVGKKDWRKEDKS